MAFGKTGVDWRSTIAAVWRSNRHFLKPITQPDMIAAESLLGIDEQKALLYRNTENFLRNQPCCHTLLWGARGVGKSSLIKTLLARYHRVGLRLIQVPREDLKLLPDILDDISSDHNHHFIIYCDDLSFKESRGEYRILKNTMEGTLEKPPANVLIYATSNRRHLMPDYMADNLNVRSDEKEDHDSAETLDEQLSVADRFGLSLSFSPMTEETYLSIVDDLFKRVKVDKQRLHEEAIRFAMQRGGPSGRTARHFLNHYHIYS